MSAAIRGALFAQADLSLQIGKIAPVDQPRSHFEHQARPRRVRMSAHARGFQCSYVIFRFIGRKVLNRPKCLIATSRFVRYFCFNSRYTSRAMEIGNPRDRHRLFAVGESQTLFDALLQSLVG